MFSENITAFIKTDWWFYFYFRNKEIEVLSVHGFAQCQVSNPEKRKNKDVEKIYLVHLFSKENPGILLSIRVFLTMT